METRRLGVGCFLFAALVAACSDDKPPVQVPVDSGSTPDTGSPVEDAGADAPSDGDTRPCEGSTIKTGTFPLSFGGTDFTYTAHVPPGYDGTKRTPLVINWHGAGSIGTEQEIFSNYDPTSDKEGFIVVYPTSPDKRWRAGLCCQPGADGGSAPVYPDAGDVRDDVGFARALVAEISKNACIDSKRVYATGMSNGGFMAHRLACEAADLFAAVAPVAGKMAIPTCTPSRPIPILDFHGTGDMTIPYDSLWSSEGVDVPTMMANWATRNGCTSGPETTFQMGNSTCKTWSQCSGGAVVTLCTQEGDGHCWPGALFCPGPDGGMSYSKDISATRASWEFFQKFVLP